MDAYKDKDEFVVEFDLPGVDVDSIDLDIERNVVTVKAERPSRNGETEMTAAERRRGVFSRLLFLGDNLEVDNVKTSYDAAVLTLWIPVAEQAKPRKIAIEAGAGNPKQLRTQPPPAAHRGAPAAACRRAGAPLVVSAGCSFAELDRRGGSPWG